jgi:SAM-dependent methyltransferase
MRQMGLAKGPNFAIDASSAMLANARDRIKNATFIQGGIEVFENADIAGADCIFLCMVAHLLEFPRDIGRLVRIAQEKKISHLVIVEEVSLYYHAFVGNPHYVELLPEGIARVISTYMRLRKDFGCPDMGGDRSAPFPTPSLSYEAWGSLGVEASRYYFETPESIGWTWQLSAADVVAEIRNRGYSVCFCHAIDEADQIASVIEKDLGGDLIAGDYDYKYEIPFWFNVHIFEA